MGSFQKNIYIVCFSVRDILKKKIRLEKVILNNAVNCLAAANTNNGKNPTSRFVASLPNPVTSTLVENNTVTQSRYEIYCISLKHFNKSIYIVTCFICYIFLQSSKKSAHTAIEVFRVTNF